MADRKFKDVHTIHETMRVKSAVWDKGGVLIYGTLNHLKYCLPNGDCGTIQTLDTPIYLTKIEGSHVHSQSILRLLEFRYTGRFQDKLAAFVCRRAGPGSGPISGPAGKVAGAESHGAPPGGRAGGRGRAPRVPNSVPQVNIWAFPE